MYEMVGSQLHFLYHANRGELAQAEQHRAQVELHAAHFGSAWQVELWEAAALLPLQLALEDVTEVVRLAHRLEEAARTVPSLRLYAKLGQLALLVARSKDMGRNLIAAELELTRSEPRSFIGWSTALSILAKAYNALGRHAEARASCERVLALMTDDDREYVTLFLQVDLEMAHADAGLGEVDRALARLDALLARFHDSGHLLTLGLLHEARARIAFRADRMPDYERSLVEVERWFGTSETPALVAKCERLRELGRPPDTLRGRRGVVIDPNDAATATIVDTELVESPFKASLD
jgi:tetratricopeptide (TPR) repeat protein